MLEQTARTFIIQRGDEADRFIDEYFSKASDVLLIAGIGFDPRCTELPKRMAEHSGPHIEAIWISELRPEDAHALKSESGAALATLQELSFKKQTSIEINIISDDNAAVGGRSAVKAIAGGKLSQYSDIVIDVSALSRGIYFPIIHHLVNSLKHENSTTKLHAIARNQPELDHAILPISNDRAEYVHGFQGETGLDRVADSIKLWLPQLVPGRQETLSLIFKRVLPDEVCPILPFPMSNPRAGDELLFEYRDLLREWKVQPAGIFYADPSSPLDLYRTILALDSKRKKIFEKLGGAVSYITPLGSKIATVGALFAAIERNLPVPYVEAVGYTFDGGQCQLGSVSETFHFGIAANLCTE